jgi:hypothetical protein
LSATAESAERRDDVGDDAVGEPRPVRLAAEIGEGEDRQPRHRGDLGRWLAPRRDEAVADPRHRQDPPRLAVLAGERTAEGGDLHRQVALLDDGAGPGAGEEVLLRHRAPARLGERGEDGEGALAVRHGHAAADEGAAPGVEHEGTEGELIHRAIPARKPSRGAPGSAVGTDPRSRLIVMI